MQNKVIVLAAGRGKRMKSKISKPLIPLGGIPIIIWLLNAIKKSGVDERPIIVVSDDNKDEIRSVVGENYDFIIQKEQLGTGHAVLCTKDYFQNKPVDNILVLHSDHPFISADSIRTILADHKKKNRIFTMATIKVKNFKRWRQPLEDFGRIIRDLDEKILEVVEKKDATPEQLKIKEVNPSYFCFQSNWLWDALLKLNTNNAQKEYYLVDLVKIAIDSDVKISNIEINALEGLGLNNLEHLNLATELLSTIKKTP